MFFCFCLLSFPLLHTDYHKNKSPERTEQEFKRLYKTYPSRHLDAPCQREEVLAILETAFSRSDPDSSLSTDLIINEHTFISDDLDTSFVKHIRYLPAFQHAHDFFELLYVLNGQCTSTLFDLSIQMRSGDICIIAPGVIYAVSAFSDEDIILDVLIRKSTFETSFLGLMEGDDILSDFFKRTFYETTEIPYLLFHTGDDRKLHTHINQTYREYGGKRRFKKQMLNAMFAEFFIILFREHEQHIEIPNIRMSKSDNNLIAILRYMQSNFATVSLREMADFFNYSERQLQRLILNATGMTFRENIQKQKMTKAARLLADSTLPVSRVCEQLGFESFNNFRKIFFRYYQMTPSAFRKNHSVH